MSDQSTYMVWRDGVMIEASPAEAAAIDAIRTAAAAAPPPPRQQLGNWFLAALADLGWLALFTQAAAAQAAPAPGGAGKPLDAWRFNTIGKSDLVLLGDSKLLRIAGRAATLGAAATPPAAGITLAAVFDRADQLAASP